MGNPSSVPASGTDLAGAPVASRTDVNATMGARPYWYCAVLPSMRTAPSGSDVRAMAGAAVTDFSSSAP